MSSQNDGHLFIPLDVDYYDDDEIIEAGERAELLYVRALGFMKRNLTDGVITKGQLSRIGLSGSESRAKQLVAVGLWELHERGYYCPAFLKRNKTKAQVRETQRLEREAAALGNHRKWHVGEKSKPSPRCDYCIGRLIDPINPPDSPATRVPDRVPDKDPTPPPDRGGESTETRTETRTRTRTRTRTGSSSTETPSASSAEIPEKPTDDPVKAKSHALSVLAFEQEVKPDIAGDKRGAFPAVMSLIERRLRAGVSVQVLEEAIRTGVAVWTLPGLQRAEAVVNATRKLDARQPVSDRNRDRIQRVVAEATGAGLPLKTGAELEAGIAS